MNMSQWVQRTKIKFCQKLGKTAIETFEMMQQVYGDDALPVRTNRFQSVDDLAAAVGVNHGASYKILTDDLNMSHVTQHSVPHILTQDQHDDSMMIYGDLISSADDDPTFLNRIITGDETWCFLYDLQISC